MRGTRARELKKQMPQDLHSKMREEMQPIAARRQMVIKNSRKQMEEEQGVAWQKHQERARQATQEHDKEVIGIMERYEKLAKERHGTS